MPIETAGTAKTSAATPRLPCKPQRRTAGGQKDGNTEGMYKIRIFFPKTESKAAANLPKTAVNRKHSAAYIRVYNRQRDKNGYKYGQNIAVKP